MMLRVDHIVWGVDDLEEAGASMQLRYGLQACKAARTSAWGTAGRIVPLEPNYLTLLAPAGAAGVARTTADRLWQQRLRQGGGLIAWCVSTDDIDAVAARLGLEVHWQWLIRPDGSELAWRIAGLEDALERPWLPFFISWQGPPDQHPGRSLGREGDAQGISWVQVGCDRNELAEWLGGESVPVRFGGPPSVNAVGIDLAGREVVIRPPRIVRLEPDGAEAPRGSLCTAAPKAAVPGGN